MAAQWEQSGTRSFSAPALASPPYQLKTVDEAVQHFLEVKRAQNTSDETLRQFRQFLEKRLLPFSNSKATRYIQQLDNAQIWGEFRSSWRNLNPLRNRRPKPGQVIEALPIAPNTARRLVEELREVYQALHQPGMALGELGLQPARDEGGNLG